MYSASRLNSIYINVSYFIKSIKLIQINQINSMFPNKMKFLKYMFIEKIQLKTYTRLVRISKCL